jgi:hypothetical protein
MASGYSILIWRGIGNRRRCLPPRCKSKKNKALPDPLDVPADYACDIMRDVIGFHYCQTTAELKSADSGCFCNALI